MTVTVGKSLSKEPAAAFVPSSKSLSHRALIAASLACGTSRIEGLADNLDVQATMRCLERLGAAFKADGAAMLVRGIGFESPCTPCENGALSMFSAYDGKPVDCGESGSTLRFLLPLFAQSGRRCIFTGRGKLMERPQDVYEELYSKEGEFVRICGAELTECFSQQTKDSFPGLITVKGTLKPGRFAVRGDISSQFISGLLFFLPLLDGDSVIEVLPPFESVSYVGLTLEALRLSGIKAEWKAPTDATGSTEIRIPGRQYYKPFKCSISADWSSAAFLAGLALTAGKPVTLANADTYSEQGDRAILDFCHSFGASLSFGAGEDIGVTIIPPKGPLNPIKADISDCPDLGPVLFALAACAGGTSEFTGVSRLRLKESDRVGCMQQELAKLGVRMEADENTARVFGPESIRGGTVLSSHNDHRIAMALSVLALRAEEPVTIEGAEAVAKSYPDFFKDLAACGIDVKTEENT